MGPQEIAIVDEYGIPIELTNEHQSGADIPIELLTLKWFRKYTSNGESVVQIELKVRRLPNAPVQGN